MGEPDRLRRLVRHLTKRHRFHTLILYGSHARGDATAASDYDLLAIRKNGTRVVRDARKWRGSYIDLFIYPESKLKPSALLQVRGGRVLIQRNDFGDLFLAKVEKLYARGPKPLPPDEAEALTVWARKMLGRIRGGDIEADFRRVWLLTMALEDYFLLRTRWYEGPKMALQWLRENDPATFGLFERALKQPANLAASEALVEAVFRRT